MVAACPIRIAQSSKNTEAFENDRGLEPRVCGLIVRAYVVAAWPIRIVQSSKNTEAFENDRELEPRISGQIVRTGLLIGQ